MSELRKELGSKDASLQQLGDDLQEVRARLETNNLQAKAKEQEHLETITYLEGQRQELDELFAEQQGELDRLKEQLALLKQTLDTKVGKVLFINLEFRKRN